MYYLTEYQDDDDKCHTRSFDDLSRARRHARYLTSRDHHMLVYVVACTQEDRVGAEAYVYGRRDSVEGVMQ